MLSPEAKDLIAEIDTLLANNRDDLAVQGLPGAATDLDKALAHLGALEHLLGRESVQLAGRAAALEVITDYGGYDGAHHKQWVLDQAVRHLTGSEYQKWVKDYGGDTDSSGEPDYHWDEGIAP